MFRVKCAVITGLLCFSIQTLAAQQPTNERCSNVYEACLQDTGIPKDQILMGVRGMCHDQQTMCEQFHNKVSSCIKDYGIKACQRIFKFKFDKTTTAQKGMGRQHKIEYS